MAKIKFDHSLLDIPDFIARMREIITAMTGNPVFAALAAKVTALDTAVNTLETGNNAYNATIQLGQQQLTERDVERVAAEEAARALASASEGETNDEAELLSGGWHLRQPPTPIGEMPAPQNLSATGGDLEGEADLQWDPVRGRNAYSGNVRPVPRARGNNSMWERNRVAPPLAWTPARCISSACAPSARLAPARGVTSRKSA
ncbi:MAG: hypothetical protein HY298_24830 [Verrucomicrobia bacterium]|nr:hypothetical protein [Verrucomicrobiota bacterium]